MIAKDLLRKISLSQRISIIFFCCILLPSAILLGFFFYNLENELKYQAILRLRNQAKNIGMSIYERLILVESEMRFFLSHPAKSLQSERKPFGSDQSRLPLKYLESLSKLSPQGSQPLLASKPHSCDIHLSELNTLDSAKPLILKKRCSNGNLHLWMAIRISDSEWLIGRINTDYLWNTAGNFDLPSDTALCVVDDRKELLIASIVKPEILVEAFSKLNSRGTPSSFSWKEGENDYVASAHTLFLKGRFLSDYWDIIISQSEASILSPMRQAKVMFLLIGFVIILMVFLLSQVLIRKSFKPLNQLIVSAKNIANENFSNRVVVEGYPEIRGLLEAFNLMSARIENRVAERTLELKSINQELINEINQRIQAEEIAKQAKGYAEAANRMKSEFLANMSHELRTPLNHIIGFTELVVDKQFGDLNEAQAEYLNDVLHGSHHLLSLINDILDLSKVEAGKLDLEVTQIHLQEILEGSLTMVKEKAIKHQIQLLKDVDGIPERIQADERKLKQILYNLLSNAVKFTPDGGSVTLSARYLSFEDGQWFTDGGQPVGLPLDEDGQVIKGKEVIDISVRDTGIGIKTEDLKRIFDPFEQADNSLSRQFQGTGLGLSLTKRLVELHGGKIWAESEGPGKGSKFSFLIPLSPYE